MAAADPGKAAQHDPVTLFLAGDIMTARGIDQVLPYPGNPMLYETYMQDARGYVRLAERANGPLPKPIGCDYIWGDALPLLARYAPDVRLANLETSITLSGQPWPNKGIHYRMHPANTACLQTLGLDAVSLANNHVLDWGDTGLRDTLAALESHKIGVVGAGTDQRAAAQAGVIDIEGKGRVIVFAFGLRSSGIPLQWAARRDRPGVNRLPNLSQSSMRQIKRQVAAVKAPGDIVVASIHWGGNWGYPVPPAHREFAHQLIDNAGVDVVHGHSSHHAMPLEVYRGKLIIYGSGDFINDYEGITWRHAYRGDLVVMYFARLEPASGELVQLQMIPLQIRQFRLVRASARDSRWLHETLNREGEALGTRVELTAENILTVTP